MYLILSSTGDDGMNMGLNPMTNDQPLQFNSNKGPTIQMGGEQSAGGNDYDQKGNVGGVNPVACYSGIFYYCQFIKSFRSLHSFWEEEDLSREIKTSFIIS